jgi:hypothetical protein
MSDGWLYLAIIVCVLAVMAAIWAYGEDLVAGCWAAGIVAAACLAFVIWWFATEPSEGTVVGRSYSPAYFSLVCSGKPVTCTSTYIPECYGIEYHDPAAPHNGSACVSPGDYARRYPLGSHYPEGALR